MSIRDFVGGGGIGLRIPNGASILRSDGEVLSGALSVEEAQAGAVRRLRRIGEGYANVGEYDPVLRAHCRLDKEG